MNHSPDGNVHFCRALQAAKLSSVNKNWTAPDRRVTDRSPVGFWVCRACCARRRWTTNTLSGVFRGGCEYGNVFSGLVLAPTAGNPGAVRQHLAGHNVHQAAYIVQVPRLETLLPTSIHVWTGQFEHVLSGRCVFAPSTSLRLYLTVLYNITYIARDSCWSFSDFICCRMFVWSCHFVTIYVVNFEHKTAHPIRKDRIKQTLWYYLFVIYNTLLLNCKFVVRGHNLGLVAYYRMAQSAIAVNETSTLKLDRMPVIWTE